MPAHTMNFNDCIKLYMSILEKDVSAGYKQTFGINKLQAEKTLRKIKSTDKALHEKLMEIVDQFTFNVRRYGISDFYCWAFHPEIQIADPWPASRFPKAVLAMEYIYSKIDKE